MFLNFKFSIFDAYTTSLRVNYKNILFYLAWYGIIAFVSVIVSFGFEIYADLLNISAMKQNYAWIVSLLKVQLKSFFVGFNNSGMQAITGFSFYDFLKLFISEDILNHTLQSMSFKEYFNVVILPKKIVLIPFFMILLSFMMAVSIGYIKTALKFQSAKKATLHDMYQYIYLLPQYLFGKMIMFLICFVPLMLMIFVGFLVLGFYTSMLKQNTPTTHAEILFIGIAFMVMLIFISYLYQRLRFMKYFIIDKEVSAFKAAKLSWDVTRGSVILLSLFSSVAVLVGVAHPMSGLFMMISLWLNQQAEVSLYRQMTGLENK